MKYGLLLLQHISCQTHVQNRMGQSLVSFEFYPLSAIIQPPEKKKKKLSHFISDMVTGFSENNYSFN